MCGIAGIQRIDGQAVRRDAIEDMVATLDHRGSDAHGVERRGSVALGHTRLSIIDLAGGVQPMTFKDAAADLAITFSSLLKNVESGWVHAGTAYELRWWSLGPAGFRWVPFRDQSLR